MYMLRNLEVGQKISFNGGHFDAEYLSKWDNNAIKEARILTIEKDTLRTKEFVLMWSEELEDDVLNYWNTINTFWNNKKLPPCTCDEQEGGFMAKPQYNPYYYNGEPCSREWYLMWKENNKLKEQ